MFINHNTGKAPKSNNKAINITTSIGIDIKNCFDKLKNTLFDITDKNTIHVVNQSLEIEKESLELQNQLANSLIRKGFKKTLESDNYFVSKEGKICYIKNGSIKQVKLKKRPVKYYAVRINARNHFVHKLVAELFCYGKTEKKCFVNHKDGNKLNNNSNNLEWSSSKEIICHCVEKLHKIRGEYKGGRSGYTGVCFKANTGKYTAKIVIRRKQKHLGTFDTAIEASIAYQQALNKSWNEDYIYEENAS